MVTELERIEYVEDPHLGKDSYCVAERHADGGACSVPDYAVIKLFRHIVQGEGRTPSSGDRRSHPGAAGGV